MAKAQKVIEQEAVESAPAERKCNNCKYADDLGNARVVCTVPLPLHIVRSQDRRLYETPRTYVCAFHKFK